MKMPRHVPTIATGEARHIDVFSDPARSVVLAYFADSARDDPVGKGDSLQSAVLDLGRQMEEHDRRAFAPTEHGGIVVTACSTCKAAEREPLSDAFEVGCDSCQARALAAIEAHRNGQNALQDVLNLLFCDPEKGWELVRQWGAKVDAARKEGEQ